MSRWKTLYLPSQNKKEKKATAHFRSNEPPKTEAFNTKLSSVR